MEPVGHEVVHRSDTFPVGLLDATEASAAMKGALTPERILALADAGYAPHFRIDGGPPLFKSSELKAWVSENLVTHTNGGRLPETVTIRYTGEDPTFFDMPEVIKSVPGIRDISRLVGIGPGIYFLCMAKDVVYVGQSANVAMRVGGHVASAKQFDRVYFLPWPEDRLDEIEGALIRCLQPKLNGRHPGGTIRAPATTTAEIDLLMRMGLVAANENDAGTAYPVVANRTQTDAQVASASS